MFTADDTKSIAPVLKAAAVPLLDMDTCRSKEVNGGRYQTILDTMICAGKNFNNFFFLNIIYDNSHYAK